MSRQFSFPSKLLVFLASIVLPIALAWGCSSIQSTGQSSTLLASVPNSRDEALAVNIAKSIMIACPVAAPGNEKARSVCGEKLAKLELLRSAMGEAVLWGGQKEAGNYNLKDSNLTAFDPFVWRRLYLSTFMFSGEPKVEQKDALTVIHLPVQFRNKLDAGEFPYPFWHSARKWNSYQQTTEVLMVMQDGKIKGGMRSAVNDKGRETIEHRWDGNWTWEAKDREQEPKVSLYDYLLSQSNPHIKTLDNAYRAFEVKLRQHSCTVCHNPSNANEMNPLLILSYPNQALSLRHRTLSQLERKQMPPPNGITDPAERQKMVELAKAFAEAGDKALAYEGEQTATAEKEPKPSSNL